MESAAGRYTCPIMEWSGRAPAPPAIEAGKGRQRQGARHVSELKHRDHALISMMASSNPLQSEAGYIDARPLTAISTKTLATHGRTIQWVIRYRLEPSIQSSMSASPRKRPSANKPQSVVKGQYATNGTAAKIRLTVSTRRSFCLFVGPPLLPVEGSLLQVSSFLQALRCQSN